MDDDWKDFEDMADDLHILFIEGYCEVPWMQNKFQSCGAVGGIKPFSSHTTFRVWCTDASYLDDSDLKPDAYGVARCKQEIESGRYHAIVVVDYSSSTEMEAFENDFGGLLRDFVADGGVVAFPSSEGFLVSSLGKFFSNLAWKRSNYYRTTWGACTENIKNINASFGNGDFSRRIIKEYSAKAVSLRGVPCHERCFGVTSNSKTQSLVPHMTGEDVSPKPGEEDDYDVVVAMHNYGKGVIAYFGDVNAEDQTIWLVAAFLESRAPKYPIDCFSSLKDSLFSEAVSLKDKGNDAFRDGKLDKAKASYNLALEKFGNKLGSNGSQKEGRLSILSNLALVHLKRKEYIEAEAVATKGLDMEWGHAKCSYRRAMARLHISRSTNGGDMTRLRLATKDVLNGDYLDPATKKLLLQIEAEIDQLKKSQRKLYGSGFAAAMSGKLR